jgi:predicted metalloprotease with PDZ domain
LGIVLAGRSGLWTNENFREYLALEAAAMDATPGRNWRPLADTAVAAQLLYESRDEGESWRRSVDFYEEGDLIWLEADVLIRQQTHGAKSLDDFCRKFHGGTSGPPQVIPYTREDVIAALNELAPYDWAGFFQQRVYAANPRAPLGGIEGAGWRLTYTNAVPAFLKVRESAHKFTDMTMSLGLTVKEDGYITDVIPGSPADKAGVGPSMKLVAVNNRRWTPDILRAAVKTAATDPAPVELLVENDDYFKTCKVDYHGGEKYAQLVRDPSKPDLLAEILKPLTPEPKLP